MNSFRNHRLRDFAVPVSTNWLLNDLAEAKGRQTLSCQGKGPAARWHYLVSKGIDS
jgi:hypothetical protein